MGRKYANFWMNQGRLFYLSCCEETMYFYQEKNCKNTYISCMLKKHAYMFKKSHVPSQGNTKNKLQKYLIQL